MAFVGRAGLEPATQRIMRTSGLSAMRQGVMSGTAPSAMRQILVCWKGGDIKINIVIV